MCLRSFDVNLSYRSKYFYPGYSHPCFVSVPCNSCEECIKSAQDDYFVRCHSEFDDCVMNGGRVAFLTFTFDDYSVPRYKYIINDNSIEFIPTKSTTSNFIYAFDKSLLQTFFNSFRKFFERLGISSPFRYFVVGEYGTNNMYSQRPHFHGLFYLSKDVVDHYSLHGYFDTLSFMFDVRRYWTYGIVSISKKGLLIDSSDGIKYVSKYVSKGVSLLSLKRFSKFYDFILSNYSVLSDDVHKSPLSLFNFYLRSVGSSLFVLKSVSFGLKAIDSLYSTFSEFGFDSFYDQFNKGYCYVDYKNGSVRSIPFSNYYRRKLFYDCRSDGSFVLNYLGFQYKSRKIHESYSDFSSFLLSLSLDNLKNTPLSHLLPIISDTFYSPAFVPRFFLYVKFIRGRSYPHSDLSFLNSIVDFSNTSFDFDSSFFRLFRSCYSYCLYSDDYYNLHYKYSHFSSPFLSYKESHPLSYCNPFFDSNFEVFYRAYLYLSNVYKSSKLLERKKLFTF